MRISSISYIPKNSISYKSAGYNNAGAGQRRPMDSEEKLVLAAECLAAAGAAVITYVILKENNIHPVKMIQNRLSKLTQKQPGVMPQQKLANF